MEYVDGRGRVLRRESGGAIVNAVAKTYETTGHRGASESFGGHGERESDESYAKAEAEAELAWFFGSGAAAMGLSGGIGEGGGKTVWDERRSIEALLQRVDPGHQADVARYCKILGTIRKTPSQVLAPIVALFVPHSWAHHTYEAFRWGRREATLAGVVLMTTSVREAFAKWEQSRVRDWHRARKKGEATRAPCPGVAGVCSVPTTDRLAEWLEGMTRRPSEADARPYNWPSCLPPCKREAARIATRALAAYDEIRVAREVRRAAEREAEVRAIRAGLSAGRSA